MESSSYKSFFYLEDGNIHFTKYETIKSTSKLEAGSYKISYDPYPVNKLILNADDDFESCKAHQFASKKKIDDLFDTFFDKEIIERITGLGFCHKIGILFYGQEGTGKSSIIKHYYNRAINENNALVFHILQRDQCITYCWDFIRNIRKTHDNPIIIVFDEFDEHLKMNESFLKTVIDGNMSINNTVFFAATNYLDKIPKAMSDRPSRFKYKLKIEGLEDTNDIENIIADILKNKVSNDEISIIAKNLKGYTLDEIKQHCFDVLMSIKQNDIVEAKIGF